jgi:tetratricopeptide (TPR) repeat protein
LASGSLAAAGCATNHDVQVRAIADPSAKMRYSGSLLAQARAQLAFNSVGLALETFRQIQREQPESAEVFAGIAACYAAMGRYDLERANYEYALAYAPHDAALLSALASSLDRLGEREQATQVRAEIARMAAAPKPGQTEQAAATVIAVPHMSSVTVKLPEAQPAVLKTPPIKAIVPAIVVPESGGQVARNMPAPHIATTTVRLPAVRRATLKNVALNTDVAIAVPQTTQAPAEVEGPAMSAPRVAAVPVALPPNTAPVLQTAALEANMNFSVPAQIESSEAGIAKIEEPNPAAPDPEPRKLAQPDPATVRAPYLERLSTGEVALVTTSEPVWYPQAAPRTRQAQAAKAKLEEAARIAQTRTAQLGGKRDGAPSPAKARLAPLQAKLEETPRMAQASGVQWVPLKYASAQPNVRILNAARSQGLAARSRGTLFDRGWRKIAIGNAREVRLHSVVFYSASRVKIARSLAAHFRCKAVKVQGTAAVVVLLGRDAVWRKGASSRA